MIARPLAVHQVNAQWLENVATSVKRLALDNWFLPYLALNGVDAASIAQDTVTWFPGQPSGYMEFDIIGAATNWKQGTATNYGLLVWATNESVDGRDLRFYSRRHIENSCPATTPFMTVLCPY